MHPPATEGMTLVILPSQIEYRLFARFTSGFLGDLPNCKCMTCGVGVVEASVQTQKLLFEVRPSRVWLVGIAGSYTTTIQTGTACEFREVRCHGIGVGSGASHQSPSQLGWNDWLENSIDSPIPLNASLDGFSLLTVTSASASFQEAASLCERYPQCAAEDMEGYAVARACELMGVPRRILRGISNRAGDRNHEHWKTEQAMLAVAELFRQQILAS